MARVLDAAPGVLPAVWVGAGGRPVVLRALEADDEALLGAFVRELSPASRHDRFHVGLTELPPAWLHALTRVDPAHEFALIAIANEGGRAVCVAEARYALDVESDAGAREFALVVADRWQGQGLGAELLHRLAAHARAHGVARLYGDVLRDNAAMIRLATRSGFSAGAHPGEGRLLRVTRPLEPMRAGQRTPIGAMPISRTARANPSAMQTS